jgi:hypothetical protein
MPEQTFQSNYSGSLNKSSMEKTNSRTGQEGEPRLQHGAFLELLRVANDLDTDIIATERSILECGLKPFDFGDAAAKLEESIQAAQRLCAELCRYSDHEESQGAIQAAVEYLRHLITTSSTMAELARKLEAKSKGDKFGFFQYRKKLKEYNKLSKSRSIAASRLDQLQYQSW